MFDWLEARVGTDGLVLSVLPTVNLPTASAQKGLGTGHGVHARPRQQQRRAARPRR